MLFSIARNLIVDLTSRRFAIGVCIGLGFSLAVILSTVGIMDGFEAQLRSRLRHQVGDLMILSTKGLYQESLLQHVRQELEARSPNATTVGLLKIEAFLLKGEKSRAVLVVGIPVGELKQMGELSGALPSEGELPASPLWPGMKLAQELALKENEQATLALARGASSAGELPSLSSFNVQSSLAHGIHEKDSRMAYTSLALLQERMDAAGQINGISIRLAGDGLAMDDLQQLGRELTSALGSEFIYRTYSSEYGTLLEAVQIEKWMITIILQIIVVISIFNVFAFLTFINEQKSSVLFLVRALGLNRRQLIMLWGMIVGALWLAGCALSIIFEFAFDILVAKMGVIELPSDIYHLTKLSMLAPWRYHIPVFLAALAWIVLFGWFYSRRYRGKAVMMGLRKEFA